MQSAFIIFDFDEHCISSQNSEESDMVYNMKNTGIIYFIIGFGFFFVCALSVLATSTHGIFMFIEEFEIEIPSRIGLLILALLLEIGVSSELFYALNIFLKMNAEYDDLSLDLMRTLLITAFVYRSVVNYGLPIIAIIVMIIRENNDDELNCNCICQRN